ncbi:uncharacterized protein B0I36DRAFT_382736 [Microdochium trichocladiopsis]|uniref:Uncharacterized protein n=1 Tax=Microdochium trichocladiopsis TaxID=1682393 RepID=A0A9P8Y7T9_9PEZI|nr:uncharacterized protein B0I36DRAFT_382736 [Microdochium trichocladiopsis]KAH7032717.1 hypothetical protein B0I36DRAFT_382736 [Microdochium trichocladiopsis]
MAHISDPSPPPICSWESFYRPSDLQPSLNYFQPLSYIASTEPGQHDPNPEGKVPAPDFRIFNFDHPRNLNNGPRLPTPAQCAVHLRLLQAFLSLRVNILCSTSLDTALSIEPHTRVVHVPHDYPNHGKLSPKRSFSSRVTPPPKTTVIRVQDPTFPKRREEKWDLYLKLAAARFLSWVRALENAASGELEDIQPPPLDVLMVWHALLLNPALLRRFELSHVPLAHLAKITFPWEKIHNAISKDDHHTFNLPTEVASSFTSRTGMEPDLLSFLTAQATRASRLAKTLRLYGKPGSSTDPFKSRGLHVTDLPEPDIFTSASDKAYIRLLRSVLGEGDPDFPVIYMLTTAVKRQSVFVDKMDRMLWIRSPALAGTLCRAVRRYERFLGLFKFDDAVAPGRCVGASTEGAGVGEERERKKTMLVPTLDVDLVWHTHMCTSPEQYARDCETLAGRVVEHNDKFGDKSGPGNGGGSSSVYEDALEYTSQLYRVRYGGDYRICLCWECEALRSAFDGDGDEDDGLGALMDGRSIEDVAHEVIIKVTKYREAEQKRRAGMPRVS